MSDVSKLVTDVLAHYRAQGRAHLPWRKTHDPYRVLVSEVMLQQTQVDRVIPKYKLFVTKFPTPALLAQAPLRDVLEVWQGLGYNRRAKFLHQAAKKVVEDWGGVLPKEVVALESLPGVGHYTARAVSVFAHNTSEVFIETNIRTVFTHHLFSKKNIVTDKELLPRVAEALEVVQKRGVSVREWYAALMDYGTHLKQGGIRINNKSAHYTKQSKFSGSPRQLRGVVLRELLQKAYTEAALSKRIKRSGLDISKILQKLVDEGFVQKRGSVYVLK